jgi:hypothetical protein
LFGFCCLLLIPSLEAGNGGSSLNKEPKNERKFFRCKKSYAPIKAEQNERNVQIAKAYTVKLREAGFRMNY